MVIPAAAASELPDWPHLPGVAAAAVLGAAAAAPAAVALLWPCHRGLLRPASSSKAQIGLHVMLQLLD